MCDTPGNSGEAPSTFPFNTFFACGGGCNIHSSFCLLSSHFSAPLPRHLLACDLLLFIIFKIRLPPPNEQGDAGWVQTIRKHKRYLPNAAGHFKSKTRVGNRPGVCVASLTWNVHSDLQNSVFRQAWHQIGPSRQGRRIRF